MLGINFIKLIDICIYIIIINKDMTTKLFKWKIFCTIDNRYEYIWQTSAPITCPVNIGHSVDLTRISKESEINAITITSLNSPYNIGLRSVIADTTLGNIIIRLPKASRSSNGLIFIKKISSPNTVAIEPIGNDLIDSQENKVLSSLNETVILLSNGTDWISQDDRANVDDSYNSEYLTVTSSKGDIVVDNGFELISESVGNDSYILQANSTTNSGLKWNNSLVDSVIYFENISDSTKKIRFDLSDITSNNTRVLSLPNSDTTLVGTSTSQTLTNKTISASSNTIIGLTNADIGLNNVQNLKVNLLATTAPTINNDSSSGYSVGSSWYDINNNKAYVCLNNTVGSAVWVEITSQGTGNVVGQSSSIDNTIVRFDGINGKVIQGSGISISDSNDITGISNLIVSNSLRVPNGTSDSPSITFQTDQNTGLYLSGSDEISITTGGTQQFVINSNGEVGIGGVTQPDYRLTIWNPSGKNGFCVRAGEVSGDIAFHIADDDDTFQIMEMEADHGYITCGKTYAQTLADNGIVYGLDLQHSGVASDFNTQYGGYRIAGELISLNHLNDIAISSPSNGQVLKYNGSNWVNDNDSDSKTIIVKDEGTDVNNTPHTSLNFVGSGVTVTDGGSGVATVTIQGNTPIFGTQYYFASSTSVSQTTSTSFQQKVRITTGSIPSGNYRVGCCYNWRGSSTSYDVQVRVQIDDTSTIIEHRQEPKDSGSNQQYISSGFNMIKLAAGTHDIDLDYATGNSNAVAYIWNAYLEIWRVS